MKIFNAQLKFNGDGSKSLTGVNCSLSFDELQIIKLACEKIGAQKNEVAESVRQTLLTQIDLL